MKLVNKTDRPEEVGLASLGTTARAWAQLLLRTAKFRSDEDIDVQWVIKDVKIGSLDIGTEPRVSDEEVEVELPDAFWDDLGAYIRIGMERLEDGIPPEDVFPDPLIQPVYDLLSSFHSDGIGTMEFQFGRHDSAMLSWDKAGQLHKAAIRELSIGSVEGTVMSLSFNKTPPYFGLRPTGGKVIECRFNADKHLDGVLVSVRKRVSVFGRIVRDGHGHPVQVKEVKRIEIIPPDDELPDVDGVFGMEPNFTGGLSTVEWVRRIRG